MRYPEYVITQRSSLTMLEQSECCRKLLWLIDYILTDCCCSVTKSCPTLGDPMNCSTPRFLPFTISRSLLKLMSIESVMPSNHLTLCHSLLLLPSVFPSFRVFSSELALCIKWPKYWSFKNPIWFFSVSEFQLNLNWVNFPVYLIFFAMFFHH